MNRPAIPQVIRRSWAAPIAEGQCNCACGMAFPLPNYASTADWSDPMHSSRTLQSIPLCHQYRVAFVPSIGEIAVLDQDAWELLSFFDVPRSAAELPVSWQTQYKSSLPKSLNELAALQFLVSDQPQPYISEADTLIAWLHITESCNLRCVYCYLPRTCSVMSPTIGRAAIEAVVRSALAHGYRKIKLKYAGGEPLLHFPLVADLHRYASDLASHYTLALDSIVLSNGTLLTPEMVETMLSLKLRLMISLDGLGDFHDCQRPYATGSGSAADVIRAIDLALAHGLVPDISITVTGRNIRGLPEVVGWIVERDLPFNFNFYRETALSSSEADLRFEEDRIVEGMLAAYQVIETNIPSHSLLASLADRANLAASHLRTCSVGCDYLVFDCRGRIAKCQMDMNHIVADMFDPDPLARVRTSTVGIQNPIVDEKSGCSDCSWRYWCTGGCPLETYRATGRYDIKSPNCTIYRSLYPEIVRLEGLRLLKYAKM